MDELTDEKKAKLRERQTELTKLIEALVILDKSKEWNVLREMVFDKSVASIERQLLVEAKESKIDTDKIFRLQGELAWARQYSDVNRFAESLKKELQAIKKLIQ